MHVCMYAYIYVMGVMKMGNIVPRAGVEPTSLAFRTNVPPLHHVGSLTSLEYPCAPVYTAPALRGQYRLLHKHIYTYIYIHIYIYVCVYVVVSFL